MHYVARMTKKNDNFTFRFPPELRKQAEGYLETQPYRPTLASLIIEALEKYLKKTEKKTK